MKKTTSSLFAATAALGIIAASAGMAFAAETPNSDPVKNNPSIGQPTEEPSAPTPEVPGDETPSPEVPGDETPGGETPSPENPGAEVPGTDQPGTEAPVVNPGAGAGAASGTVGGSGVTSRSQISTGNGPAPVSARGGIRGANAPAEANSDAPASASNPTLANTGSTATIAAGAGVIALAGGVTLVIARKRH